MRITRKGYSLICLENRQPSSGHLFFDTRMTRCCGDTEILSAQAQQSPLQKPDMRRRHIPHSQTNGQVLLLVGEPMPGGGQA